MPRYFLHFIDGDTVIKDDEGAVFPGVPAARRSAIITAREILADMLMSGEPLDGQRIEIETEAGELVDTVKLSDQIRLTEEH